MAASLQPDQQNSSESKPALSLDSKDEFPWSGMKPAAEYIVSVDFGSFGFAAAWCPTNAPRYERMIQDWSDTKSALELYKNLTALLIDKKTKKIVTMGFEAEMKYNESQEKKEEDQYLYFQHFKPYLYSTYLYICRLSIILFVLTSRFIIW